MMESADPSERIAALAAEIERLTKVNEALMNRVERSTDAAGSSYSLFESNLLLQNKLDEHTGKLIETNHALQREIGERKRVGEALRKERDFSSVVVDTAGALVVVLDTTGRIVRFNRTCEQITGYGFEEVRDRHFWDIFLVPEEMAEVKATFARLRAGHFPSQFENYWLTKSGDRRLIAWSNTAIVDDDDVVEHIIGTGIDITERKRAEEALRFSEERFRKLVENANEIIYSLDAKGRFTYLSPKFEKVTGFRDEDYLGRPLEDLLHEDDAARARRWFIEGIESGEKSEGNEWRALDKKGNLRWFVSNSSMIPDDEGHVQEIIGVAHDITKIKMLVEDLEKANRNIKATQAQLVQSEKMASLGKLVAGIAHEINTPIGSVGSMHDTLMKATDKLCELVRSECREDSPKFRKMESLIQMVGEANRVIKMGTDRVTTIVRRLRAFARLDEAELVESDIHEGLEDTLTLIHHEIKYDIVVHRNYGKDVPRIYCYMARLNQVFVNFLINAKQAIQGKGEITIATTHENDKVIVRFTDTGAGIPKESLGKIFDPGFTTKGVGIGTGLGLSIVFQIIQEHHGEILVESEVGKGTTFTIILPTNLKEILKVS